MLKAIETKYKGYRFRSRLEARWAVFFDALGIKWEYEVEGFDLGTGGLYLPDFFLPERGMWIEIKGRAPTEEELKKVKILSLEMTQLNGSAAMLVAGTPESEEIYLWNTVENNWLTINYQTDIRNYWLWCDISCRWLGGGTHPQHVLDNINTCPRIRYAYQEARGARFEHGETPNFPTIIRERRKVKP